jgi:hypothetical protein
LGECAFYRLRDPAFSVETGDQDRNEHAQLINGKGSIGSNVDSI